MALFLQSLKTEGLLHAAQIQAVAAIRNSHDAELETDPTGGQLVHQLLQADKRRKVGIKHREPATPEHLEHIATFVKNNPSDVNRRTLVISTKAYAG